MYKTHPIYSTITISIEWLVIRKVVLDANDNQGISNISTTGNPLARPPPDALMCRDFLEIDVLKILRNAALLWEGRCPLDSRVTASLYISYDRLVVLRAVCAVAIRTMARLYVVVDVVRYLFLIIWSRHVGNVGRCFRSGAPVA